MDAILVGVASVWIGSIVLVSIGFLIMWRADYKARAAGAGAQRGSKRRSERGVSVEEPRQLAPDPRLLVPWSAVRSDKQRLGVEAGTLGSEGPSIAGNGTTAPGGGDRREPAP